MKLSASAIRAAVKGSQDVAGRVLRHSAGGAERSPGPIGVVEPVGIDLCVDPTGGQTYGNLASPTGELLGTGASEIIQHPLYNLV